MPLNTQQLLQILKAMLKVALDVASYPPTYFLILHNLWLERPIVGAAHVMSNGDNWMIR